MSKTLLSKNQIKEKNTTTGSISFSGYPGYLSQGAREYCDNIIEIRDYYKELLNSILNPLIVIGSDKKIKFQNRESVKMFGDTRGLYCYNAMPLICEKIQVEFCTFDLLQKKQQHEVEVKIEENGKEIYYKLNVTKIGDEDLLLQFINITDSVKREQELFINANHDYLTNIPNRAFFMTKLIDRIKNSNRREDNFALLYIDLDLFKGINDFFGHNIGDLVLIEVAKRMSSCLRSGDIVARVGGDEFTVLLDSVSDESDIKKVVDKIQKCFEITFDIGGESVNLGVSIGIGSYKNGEHYEEFLDRVDKDMFYNKGNKKIISNKH